MSKDPDLDNVSWAHRIHNMKFGVDFNINPEQQLREANYSGLYLFKTAAGLSGRIGGRQVEGQPLSTIGCG